MNISIYIYVRMSIMGKKKTEILPTGVPGELSPPPPKSIACVTCKYTEIYTYSYVRVRLCACVLSIYVYPK